MHVIRLICCSGELQFSLYSVLTKSTVAFIYILQNDADDIKDNAVPNNGKTHLSGIKFLNRIMFKMFKKVMYL